MTELHIGEHYTIGADTVVVEPTVYPTQDGPRGYYVARIIDAWPRRDWQDGQRGQYSKPSNAAPAIDIRDGNAPVWDDVIVRACPLGIFARNCDSLSIRGCIFRDISTVIAPDGSRPHSQGILAKDIGEVLIEDCVFYRIGHNPDNPLAPRTKFNHGVYLKNSIPKVTIRNCWFISCSNFGVQMRGGGTLENCVFHDCAGAIQVGREDIPPAGNPFPVEFDISNVLITGACDIGMTGQAWGIHVMNTKRGSIKNVLFAEPSTAGTAKSLLFDGLVKPEYGYHGIDNLSYENICIGSASSCKLSPTISENVVINPVIGPIKNLCKHVNAPSPALIDSLINRPAGVYTREHDATEYIKATFQKSGMV